MIDRAAYRRQRAVLLTARALAAEEESRDTARTLAVDATKLAPDLVPAAALAGRLLAEGGERRKAGRILEAAWKANPHPDLAETYAHVRLSDSARDRLSRMQALARLAPRHAESALAVARAALDAREFAVVREALSPLNGAPTQRVAMLMVELEQLEGDEGRAREWMGRALNAARDPAWAADGYVSDRWLPVSPVTGRLDAFEWKVPVAELGPPAPLTIEAPAEPTRPELLAQELPREVPSPPLGNVTPEVTAPRAERPAPRPAPIIPLTAVPDDPGPEPEADTDAELAEPKPDPWQRFRQFFR
jgi:HemY protein